MIIDLSEGTVVSTIVLSIQGYKILHAFLDTNVVHRVHDRNPVALDLESDGPLPFVQQKYYFLIARRQVQLLLMMF